MRNAIEVKNVTKHYPGFTLDNISFTLPSGSILGLVGENGAGKSTTIRLILDAIPRDGGEIRVLGRDNRAKEFTSVKNDIGVVLDEAYFPEVLTARQINAVMKHTYANWSEDAFFRHLQAFAVPPKKAVKDLSRGMRMKLAIAVALSHNPKLLILDEATSGLDPLVRDEILDIFNDFTRDESRSVLFSSHIVSDLEKICDYIAFIHKGKLIFCEEKDRLLEEYALLRLPKARWQEVPPRAVVSKKETPYGGEALVRRSAVPAAWEVERTTLEDIILFMARGDGK